MVPEDVSNNAVAQMHPKDTQNDVFDGMGPEDIPDGKVPYVGSNYNSNNSFETPFPVFAPLQRKELFQATESIQSGRDPAIIVKGLSANTVVADNNNTTEATPLLPTRPIQSRSVKPNGRDTFESVNAISDNVSSASHSPSPVRQVKTDLKKSRKGLRKASRTRHSYKEPTQVRDEIQNEQSESAVIRLHEDDVAFLNRTHRASKVKISSRSALHTNITALEKPQEKPLLANIVNDLCGIIKDGIEVFSKLSRSFYRRCKWVLFSYVTWLFITYLWVCTRRFATTALVPMCSTPVVGPRIPFCIELLKISDRPVNTSKIASSQEDLVVVLDRTGQIFHLARDKWDGVFAVRDLRIRVELSDLVHREALEAELKKLIQDTEKTFRDVSQFASQTSHTILGAELLDDYVVKTLERIAKQQQNRPSPLDRVILAISPYAAFGPANIGYTEEQLKQVFINAANKIADDVNSMIKASSKLDELFEKINLTLERVKRHGMIEIDHLPRTNVLSELWARVAHVDDYEKLKSHPSLLTDMAEYYENSSYVIKETNAALIHIGTELGAFRDGFIKPQSILKEQPLENIIALFKKAGQRLKVKQMELDWITRGGLPQPIAIWKTVTREVTLMKTQTLV